MLAVLSFRGAGGPGRLRTMVTSIEGLLLKMVTSREAASPQAEPG
jgi:hypothetical protein